MISLALNQIFHSLPSIDRYTSLKDDPKNGVNHQKMLCIFHGIQISLRMNPLLVYTSTSNKTGLQHQPELYHREISLTIRERAKPLIVCGSLEEKPSDYSLQIQRLPLYEGEGI
ncbi:hypothetical protein O181_100702 [Austropuccinia psidii MF-1]|uniref:Uncharacterized protein n=1 Tax=Austropuccinia psidii MF-1 TaxID=1389203 RepID=A0A9Q3JFS0_9BASI|nr:hypothetical protein [Austropuccinia psidii MF-1]